MIEYPISIVTPWRNHPELIEDYEAAVRGAQVIIVDNGSDPETADGLAKLAKRLGGVCLRNEQNLTYGKACNLGMQEASRPIRICLNNDIVATGDWLGCVVEDVTGPSLYGPELAYQRIDGVDVPFLSGWCIACVAETWEDLKGFDTEALPGNYWEDNDLCFRAIISGRKLCHRPWPIVHLGGVTARSEPGAYDTVNDNREAFLKRLRAWGQEGLIR